MHLAPPSRWSRRRCGMPRAAASISAPPRVHARCSAARPVRCATSSPHGGRRSPRTAAARSRCPPGSSSRDWSTLTPAPPRPRRRPGRELAQAPPQTLRSPILAPSTSTSLGHLSRAVARRSPRASASRHRQPGQQRQPAPLAAGRLGTQRPRRSRGAGRGLPLPRQPAAAGGLVLGDHDAPGLRPAGRLERWWSRASAWTSTPRPRADRAGPRPRAVPARSSGSRMATRLGSPAMAQTTDAIADRSTRRHRRPARRTSTSTPPPGKLADLNRRVDEAVHAGLGAGGREAARQGQEDRPRADRAAARRGLVRRARRAAPGTARPRFGLERNRPYGDGVVTGYGTVDGRPVCGVRPGLHRLRRLPRRGLRREDRQGHGPRHEDRLPDHRHQRLRRRAHPGGRGLARPVRRDLPPQRPRLRRHPADLA